jgi:cyclic lactone autoinducer peptide
MKANKKVSKLHRVLATITKRSAISGAGLASTFGYYQPKAPKKIAK